MIIIISILLFAMTSSLWAAPPVDLTDQTGELARRLPVEKRISEDDITFTDTSTRGPISNKLPEDAVPAEYEVPARTAPNRSGRVIQTVKKGEYVRFVGYSRDGRWVAVELLRGKRTRTWLPRSAIKIRKQSGVSATKKPFSKSLPLLEKGY